MINMHQKRISIPKSWKVPKKTYKWITSTNPGPHNKLLALPLIILIRDLLHLCNTLNEGKKILQSNNILINGTIRKNTKFPVGLFDVLSIKNEKKNFKLLQNKKGQLYLKEINEDESKWKLCKIINITSINKETKQLNLNDGTNILVNNNEIYNTKDTIKISLPEKKILNKYEYHVGSLIIIIGGSHNGEIGTIKKIIKINSSKNNIVLVSSMNKDQLEFETIEKYIFVISEEEKNKLKNDIEMKVNE